MTQIYKEERPAKIGWKIIIFSIVLSVLSILFACLRAILKGTISEQSLSEGRIGEMIGATFAPIIVSLIIVALFQFFKRFRNRRSRWKIYCWSLVVMCISTLGQILPQIAPATGA